MKRKTLAASVIGGLAAASILGAISLYFGSAEHAIAYLGGRDVIIRPLTVNARPHQHGDGKAVLEFVITNLTSKSLKVTGVHVECACTVPLHSRPLPAELQPRGSLSFLVEVDMDAFTGSELPKRLTYYTNSKSTPRLEAAVFAPRHD